MICQSTPIHQGLFSEAYDRKFGNEAAATYAWGMEVRNEFKEEICNASPLFIM